MKTNLLFITIVVGLVSSHSPGAQDSQTEPASNKATDATAQTSPEKPKLTQEELEAKFKATLTRATLAGRWCLIKDGALGPEKDDKYTISSVMKLGGDAWLIIARIQYGKRDITAPIPVKVKWAGDTPVLIVDTVGVPGSGTYSARVLIYEKTYAGTWTGGDHGGLLSGIITNQTD